MFHFQGAEQLQLYFGASLFFGGYLLDKILRTTAAENKKVKQSIEQLKKQDNRKLMQLLTRPENRGRRVNIAYDRVTALTTNDSLFIRIRQMPLHVEKPYTFKNVSGGSFKFAYDKNEVIVDVDDAHVFSSILSKSQQNVQIFGHMQPVVKKVAYFIKNRQILSVVGVLSYDFATKKFRIQPKLMGFSISELIQQFDTTYMAATIPRFFTFSMIGISIYLLWKPMKRIFSYLKSKIPYFRNKEQARNEREMQFIDKIKTKIDIKAQKQNPYECVKCKKNVTNIIYKCGHLCICEECHQKRKEENGEQNVCPLCNNISKHQLKIFFG